MVIDPNNLLPALERYESVANHYITNDIAVTNKIAERTNANMENILVKFGGKTYRPYGIDHICDRLLG